MSRTPVRVNVKSRVVNSSIRRERRDGRDLIIVPSATMPDGVVMNKIRYPGDEIAKSFYSLNRSPAPLGHPTINGSFISAKDPEGLTRGWIGAWNENVRRENGRVLLDKVIDVAIASQSPGGKSVLEAIEKGEPIHTSTGLYCFRDSVENATDGADFEAREITFDHDAILLGEVGAATPEQGVGMMVNKAVGLNGQQIEIINSALEDAERELDWAADYAVRAAEKISRIPFLESVKAAIMKAVQSLGQEETSNMNKDDTPMNDSQFNELKSSLAGLGDGLKKLDTLGETITNAITAGMKPMLDAQAEAVANQRKKDDAEKVDLVAKVVKAGLLEEAVANTLALPALQQLATKAAKPAAAVVVNGRFTPPAAEASETGGFKLPSAKE